LQRQVGTLAGDADEGVDGQVMVAAGFGMNVGEVRVAAEFGVNTGKGWWGKGWRGEGVGETERPSRQSLAPLFFSDL
jgi:hypothetical protein